MIRKGSTQKPGVTELSTTKVKKKTCTESLTDTSHQHHCSDITVIHTANILDYNGFLPVSLFKTLKPAAATAEGNRIAREFMGSITGPASQHKGC